MILSEAGKSIYSRHGSDAYTSSVTGVLNTFLSTFQQAENELRCFQAGKTKFAFLTRKPLHLVAITRLPESDVQLQAQLDALYMQLLSALTLPNIERLFARNPAADLRRLLNGTEKLLSALADDLTRGSPSTLLSALESLRLKKDSRMAVNDTLLKQRSPSLLYGLIVAAGRLVSVVRPQKHSLYPGDLHLLFNMLFEAGSVRVGDGDNWIPICLPGFNRDGYLYLYVSSLYRVGGSGGDAGHRANQNNSNGITILLVSPHKEAFYELRDMRNQVEHVRHSPTSSLKVRRLIWTSTLSEMAVLPLF